MISRYVVALPISDKIADTVARVFFDRWLSVCSAIRTNVVVLVMSAITVVD
jgi:hypothetical protein